MTQDWRGFVIEYGRRVDADILAAILGQPSVEIDRVRRQAGTKPGPRRPFAELFTLYRGRPPLEEDWPKPRKQATGYEWLPPELAELARLVGLLPAADIAKVLTERLRRITGDPTAERAEHTVNVRVHKLGLLQSDVLGGLTILEAAKRAGVTKTLIYQELRRGTLRSFRVGDRHVIPVAVLDAWKGQRLPEPPKGWVKLWDIERSLGLKERSSRLSWYAKNGLVPGALFCAGHRWWISPEGARELVRRARAGEPLPWHGKYTHPSVTKRSFDLWQRRRHRDCAECTAIWQRVGGAPRTFEKFYPRWTRIPESMKRHVTSPDGLSAARAAEYLGIDKHTICRAIAASELSGRREGPRWVIRRADLDAWVQRPDVLSHHGDQEPLTFKHAAARYQFTEAFLRQLAADGLLVVAPRKDGRPGVRPWQIASLRARLGDLTLSQAAAAAGVSPQTFVRDARARGWRDGQPFTQEWVDRVRARQDAPWQLTLAEAAQRLGRTVAWVRHAIDVGVLKALKGVDRRQRVVGRKLVEQLLRNGIPELPPTRGRGRPVEWLQGFQACELAGVTIATIKRWAAIRAIRSRTWRPSDGPYGVRYHKGSVEKRARHYWLHENKFKRATPPAWLTTKEAA